MCACVAFLSLPALPLRPAHRARRRRRRPSGPGVRAAAAGAGAGAGAGDVENLVIIGSGPAGYTAAIYAARANLKPVVLEGLRAGPPGGQLTTTTDVDNFPGFPGGVGGPELMRRMRAQARRWGAELVPDDAVGVDVGARPLAVRRGAGPVLRAHSVIVATGARARRLRVKGEDAFWARGISACAICDGAAPIFSGVELAVVGGGDSACEEAAYLASKFASQVHMLVRGGSMRASRTMQDRALMHPKVQVHYDTVVLEPFGSHRDDVSGSPLKGLRVRNLKTNQESELGVRGVFYAIGHDPNTSILRESGVELDEQGYVKVRPGTTETNIEGVFAAGDVADKMWRQAVTAAGSGCIAALAAERYLTANSLTKIYRRVSAVEGDPDDQPSPSEKQAEVAGSDDKDTYDISNTWHKGQYALRKLYHESDRPLIVKYISPGCGPCGQLKPILNSLIRNYETRIHYVEIDITKDPEIAEAAGVTGSPTVHLFYEKARVAEFRGVKMKSAYRKAIDECLEKVKVKA